MYFLTLLKNVDWLHQTVAESQNRKSYLEKYPSIASTQKLSGKNLDVQKAASNHINPQDTKSTNIHKTLQVNTSKVPDSNIDQSAFNSMGNIQPWTTKKADHELSLIDNEKAEFERLKIKSKMLKSSSNIHDLKFMLNIIGTADIKLNRENSTYQTLKQNYKDRGPSLENGYFSDRGLSMEMTRSGEKSKLQVEKGCYTDREQFLKTLDKKMKSISILKTSDFRLSTIESPIKARFLPDYKKKFDFKPKHPTKKKNDLKTKFNESCANIVPSAKNDLMLMYLEKMKSLQNPIKSSQNSDSEERDHPKITETLKNIQNSNRQIEIPKLGDFQNLNDPNRPKMISSQYNDFTDKDQLYKPAVTTIIKKKRAIDRIHNKSISKYQIKSIP